MFSCHSLRGTGDGMAGHLCKLRLQTAAWQFARSECFVQRIIAGWQLVGINVSSLQTEQSISQLIDVACTRVAAVHGTCKILKTMVQVIRHIPEHVSPHVTTRVFPDSFSVYFSFFHSLVTNTMKACLFFELHRNLLHCLTLSSA